MKNNKEMASRKKPQSYVLTPNLGEGKKRILGSFKELQSQMLRMEDIHSRFLIVLRKEHPECLEGVAEVGYSFFLRKSPVNEVLVGVSDHGWIIYRMKPKPTEASQGTKEGNGIVAFLFPERTEKYERELISRDEAMVILKRWIEDPSENPIFPIAPLE